MRIELTRKQVRAALQLTLPEPVLLHFNALNEPFKTAVLDAGADVQRMVLMLLQKCVEAGIGCSELEEGNGLLIVNGDERVKCLVGCDGIAVKQQEETLHFSANYYGQMQWHQWLEGL